MSFPKEGKVFPEEGNVSPEAPTGGRYTLAIAAALRREVGGTHRAIKTVATWTGASERTVKNWFAGTSGPSGDHLISLMRHSNKVFEALLLLSGKEETVVTRRMIDARVSLLEVLDLLRSVMKQGM